MNMFEFAVCPKDGTIAVNIAGVKKLFGTRVNNKKLIVQSWCRKCRNKKP